MTRTETAATPITARAQADYEQRPRLERPSAATVNKREVALTSRTATPQKRAAATKAKPVSYTARKPKRIAATTTAQEVKSPRVFRKKLALLLPGHNEELIIATTIRSALAAGITKRDIYVVDDNSSDKTREIAISLLGERNVLTVERSGKAGAVLKAIAHFNIEEEYTWLHVADADSIFSPDYFKIYKSKLDAKKYAVAVGFVQSMRGNWISTYRALTYTYSQHVSRRIQSRLGMISVFPGPITCFRTDILSKLEFTGNSLTEDFDITLQVHRDKLGKIVFIPGAINYTQDPQSLDDFWKQNLRWQRGFFQGVKKYRIGTRGQLIDVSLGFQMAQMLLFMLQAFVMVPIVIAVTGNWMIIPVAIAADITINGLIAIGSSVIIKRWNLIGALPYFYFLRWIEITAYLTGFFEVMVLGKFQSEIKGWGTEGRRYKLSEDALQDIA
jgi:cellulose synthase/poly-beta-1,6-N-acetylglucosamine synthase-like glycosyltransferase